MSRLLYLETGALWFMQGCLKGVKMKKAKRFTIVKTGLTDENGKRFMVFFHKNRRIMRNKSYRKACRDIFYPKERIFLL